MTTQTLPLNFSRTDFGSDSQAAPMLGRAWALLTASGARRAAAELRREAAVIGDKRSPKYQNLVSLAHAIEASKC